jgi:hypothetical protein
VAERQETADAAGVVGDGAVADSTVVVGSTSVEDGSGGAHPALRLVVQHGRSRCNLAIKIWRSGKWVSWGTGVEVKDRKR